MIVTARISNPKNGFETTVNVILDSGSNISLMTENTAQQLNLEGTEAPFKLSGIGDVETNNTNSRYVDITVSSMDGTFSENLKGIQVIPVITNDVKAYDWRSFLSKYGIEGYPPTENGQIDLLIGWDHPYLLLHREFRGVNDQLLLIKTSLGWSGCGIVSRRQITWMKSFQVEYRNPDNNPLQSDVESGYNSELTDEGENEYDKSQMIKNLSFVAASRKEASTDIKRLIELVQNSCLYDNFPESGTTVEEDYCTQILQNTYRTENGKAYVSPLWKKGQPSGFVNNYGYALARFKSILKGMSEEHFDCIDNIFEEYITKHKVAEEVTDEVKDPWKEHAIWWAHFPTLNPNSETTPVRPVMDGKAQCINGKSINDHCFSPGPCLLTDLVEVLLRYRKYDEAFTGDISKMFLKINVPPDCKKYGRFIWCTKDRKNLRYFQFLGHVFGKVCSPTCSLYATQRNATEHADRMPRAAESVKKSTLVDDTLDSVPTEDEAVQVIKDLVEMHKHIGLEISKFATTSLNVAKRLPDSIKKSEKMLLFENFGPKEIEYAPGTVPKMPTMRALGQYHNMVEDTLGYMSYEPDKNITWTKTRCLSQAMKIFDPLGYAIPVLLETKLFMQELWRRGTEWTDTLTEGELERWQNWLQNLPLMEHLSFRRVIMPGLPSSFSTVQLHVFTDASHAAFASVAYIRITYEDDRPIYTNFIQAKNNIAPMKVKRTTPKLELMSIEQGARLAKQICGYLNIPTEDVTIWSDSKTALQWLRMDSNTLLLIVHNYCEKTKALFPIEQIRWVPGPENPADVATRPKSVPELVNLTNWTKGPDFLMDSPSEWPTLPELERTKEVMDGVKKDYKIFSASLVQVFKTRTKQKVEKDLFDTQRYRTYGKMLRTISFVLRFIGTLRKRVKVRQTGTIPVHIECETCEKEHHPLLHSLIKKGFKKSPRYFHDKHGKVQVRYETVPTDIPGITIYPRREELEEAELRLVHQHQRKYFTKEIKDILCGRDLLVSSKLCRLGAIIVPQKSCIGTEFTFNLLRLGGRVGHASHLNVKMRQPYVLHPDDEMVKKLVQHYHGTVLKHMGGVKCLMCEINRSRWIVGSIAHIKRILNECIQCRKLRPKPTIQQMAPLPSSRIPGEGEERLAPFSVTSLDAAGPWLTSQGRGKSRTKRWLIIFRCAKYGAVHLEMLHHMNTASFLKALTRFVSHCAKPKRIYCDNGTNFVRGEKEINHMWDEISQNEVEQNEHQIEFKFSPANAPHFNGLVERMVGEAKKNLLALLPTEGLTDEDLDTAFKEVQRLLNNRPLDLLSSVDPNDLEPLTPAHFMSCGNIHEDLVPPKHYLEGRETLAQSYWDLKALLDTFWTRYVRSVTPHLKEYTRWVTKRKEVKPGDVVCLLEDNPEADGHYKLGLIDSVQPGIDGLVRRVSVRVKDGKILERGLNRIYVLVPVEKLQPKGKEVSPETETKQALRRSKRIKRRQNKKKNTSLFCCTFKCNTE